MKNQKKEIDRLPSECTSIVVGSKMTADGSRFISRSMDWDAMNGINFELHDDTECGPTEFVAKDSPFRCELPAKALGYSATPDCLYAGEWGSAGFNSLGVGMSSTESIFSSDEALKHDPLVPAGLAENCVFNITLPYIHSSREGVERLASSLRNMARPRASASSLSTTRRPGIWRTPAATCGWPSASPTTCTLPQATRVACATTTPTTKTTSWLHHA